MVYLNATSLHQLIQHKNRWSSLSYNHLVFMRTYSSVPAEVDEPAPISSCVFIFFIVYFFSRAKRRSRSLKTLPAAPWTGWRAWRAATGPAAVEWSRSRSCWRLSTPWWTAGTAARASSPSGPPSRCSARFQKRTQNHKLSKRWRVYLLNCHSGTLDKIREMRSPGRISLL